MTLDAEQLLDDTLHNRGGGLLPLGSEAGTYSGYKVYGLAVMVDILTGICSGGDFGEAVHDSPVTSARVCHFFMAIRIDLFREAEVFKKDVSAMLAALSSLEPAEGAERVYYPGQIKYEAEAACETEGVPLEESVWHYLQGLGAELGVAVPPEF